MVSPKEKPGRACPRHYRYAASVFTREPTLEAESIFVAGGLYGNVHALDVVLELARSEGATLVFDGDFNWFNVDAEGFSAINGAVLQHVALRGNVETEIARPDDIGAGCGCAYPETIDDGVVRRSNEILSALRRTAAAAGARLAGLPMHLVAAVGGLRIGLVHGDASALAGWRFDVHMLDDAANRAWLRDIRMRSQVDVFASTHTCLAALRHVDAPAGALTVINNGAAGMPNFSGAQFGLISRIATHKSPCDPVYGTSRDGVFIDALAVPYDTAAFVGRFLKRWPAGSPAHASYFRRIIDGPDHAVASARPSR